MSAQVSLFPTDSLQSRRLEGGAARVVNVRPGALVGDQGRTAPQVNAWSGRERKVFGELLRFACEELGIRAEPGDAEVALLANMTAVCDRVRRPDWEEGRPAVSEEAPAVEAEGPCGAVEEPRAPAHEEEHPITRAVRESDERVRAEEATKPALTAGGPIPPTREALMVRTDLGPNDKVVDGIDPRLWSSKKATLTVKVLDGPHEGEVSLWKPGMPLPSVLEKRLPAGELYRELLEKRWRNAFRLSLATQLLMWLCEEVPSYPTPLSTKQVQAWDRMKKQQVNAFFERRRAAGDDLSQYGRQVS